VSPGLVRTPLTEPVYRDAVLLRAREQAVPLGRIATAEDIAGAIAWLASPQAAYVTGVDVRLDGGLADRVLATVPGKPKASRS
jgi:glucose 1-dehydrogenase